MKTGFVAMVGLPNAGKSTLVNALIGEKVGIISRKPQTTRKRVIGIYNDKNTQIAFVDSPGRVQATTGLNSFLEKELEDVIKGSDACLAILNLDAHSSKDLLDIVELVKKSKRPWAVIINKTDLDMAMSGGARETRLREELREIGVPVIACSAIKSAENLREKLLPVVRDLLPETEAPLFTDDIYTTQTTRDLVAEIVREKCFEYLHQEIPYGLAVKVLKYDESGNIPKIYVEIIVTKENFVSMVVGRNGQTIKRIGASARIDAEKALGQKIYLETHVKVKRDWAKDGETMRELGYVTTN